MNEKDNSHFKYINTIEFHHNYRKIYKTDHSTQFHYFKE